MQAVSLVEPPTRGNQSTIPCYVCSATLQHPNDLLKSDASAVRSVFHKCILTDNLSALDEHHRNVVKLFSSVHVAVELIQETLLHLLHRKMLVVTEE